MATWQHDLLLIPRAKVLERCGSIPSQITSEEYEQQEWWIDATVPDDLEGRLSKFLEPSSSWSDSVKTWGVEDGNRIDVCYSDGRVCEISVRIDIRQRVARFLQDILDLASSLDCVFYANDGEVFGSDRDAVVRNISGSPAFSFVVDPEQFLESISED